MTTYIKNDKVHVAASIPAIRLEGTETSAANLELRENAGNIELYDVTNAVVRAQWSGATGKRLTPLIVAAEIAADAVITVKILDANVTLAKIANGTGLSLIGRSANTAGVNADIVGTDGQVARVSGTALGFGTVVAAGIASDAVTTIKILDANVTAAKLAADAVITAKILNANVTYAKIQNVSATDKLLGRSTAGAGVTEEIACTTAGRALLDDVDAPAQLITLGVTATAAELNTLDGILPTVTELNYVDGVTSAIQTQINTKAPLAGPTFTGLVKKSTTAAITAFATGGQASAVELVSDINEVSVCATAADSVKLPGGIAGMEIMVVNRGAAAMNLFPAVGDFLNELAVDTAVSIAIDATAIAFCYIADKWEVIESVRA